jgi:hypothetical protein
MSEETITATRVTTATALVPTPSGDGVQAVIRRVAREVLQNNRVDGPDR